MIDGKGTMALLIDATPMCSLSFVSAAVVAKEEPGGPKGALWYFARRFLLFVFGRFSFFFGVGFFLVDIDTAIDIHFQSREGSRIILLGNSYTVIPFLLCCLVLSTK